MNLTFYDKIFKPKEYVLPNGKKAYKKASRAPIYTILILAMCALSVKITGFDMKILGNLFLTRSRCHFWDLW